MMSWYEFDMEYKKGLVIKVDMRCICMINILLGCLNTICMWLIRNSLKSLGEISRSCLSVRDVIP